MDVTRSFYYFRFLCADGSAVRARTYVRDAMDDMEGGKRTSLLADNSRPPSQARGLSKTQSASVES